MTSRRKLWLVAIPCAAYLVVVLVGCVIMMRFVDVWWPATVLAFAPRWPLLLPAVALIPAALYAKERAWAAAASVAASLVLVAYMDFQVPFPRTQPAASQDSAAIRVVTYNVHGAGDEPGWLDNFLAGGDADIISLQECGSGLVHGNTYANYFAAYSNSHCLLSRFPITVVDARDQTDAWEKGGSGAIVRFELDLKGRTIQIVLVHLETVRKGLEALQHERLGGVPELEANTGLRRWESQIAREWSRRGGGPTLVVGDFNMPVESAIYREFWSHLTNAFSECGTGYGSTKHTRWHGIRIDHVLMDDAWMCEDATIGAKEGSDHAPMFVTLRLRSSV
jgi:vancomycin resistance protein VanJ